MNFSTIAIIGFISVFILVVIAVFIYIKPTIINILFGLTLIFGKYFTNEPLLKKLMGKSVSLTNEVLSKEDESINLLS